MRLSIDDCRTIREHFKVPEHIMNCARAIRYDLMHGPSWSLIPGANIEAFTSPDYFATLYDDLIGECEVGDQLVETYVGPVAKALQDYISELPSESYLDTFSGECLEDAPEPYVDEDEGTCVEPNWEDYILLRHRDLVEVLFGKVIADEFK
jgi:hypothetical protein